LPTVCGESGSAEKNPRHKVGAFDLWLACGFGCLASLPEGAIGFATGELKTNFIGSAREGGVSCAARVVHTGRSTQVWDAEIQSEATGKVLALFRCTQMLLYPPGDTTGRKASKEPA